MFMIFIFKKPARTKRKQTDYTRSPHLILMNPIGKEGGLPRQQASSLSVLWVHPDQLEEFLPHFARWQPIGSYALMTDDCFVCVALAY